MNFYVASSFKNIEDVRTLADRLKAEGLHHTYDWTRNSRADTIEKLSTIGESEKEAVLQSDLFIMLFPAGFGSHVELGIALGSGKRIYLYSPTDDIDDFEKTATFYHVKGVNKYVGSFDSFIEHLLMQEKVERLQ